MYVVSKITLYFKRSFVKLEKLPVCINFILSVCSVQSLSHVRLFATPWIAACQASLSPTPGVYSNSCPSSWWCYPAISSSVTPFSSCPQSLQASGSFPMSQLFAWGGQSIGGSASASVLPMNIQDWSPLGDLYVSIPLRYSLIYGQLKGKKHWLKQKNHIEDSQKYFDDGDKC